MILNEEIKRVTELQLKKPCNKCKIGSVKKVTIKDYSLFFCDNCGHKINYK